MSSGENAKVRIIRAIIPVAKIPDARKTEGANSLQSKGAKMPSAKGAKVVKEEDEHFRDAEAITKVGLQKTH